MGPRNIESYLPSVSIIILNYNGYEWLKLFMPSFINTRYPNFELIVVDNASTDESLEFLRNNYENVRVIPLEKNKGFAEGVNIGARNSKGKVLAFMNNDMEVHPDWLANAISILLSDSMVGAVQCKIMQYKNKNKIDVIGHSVDRYGLVYMIGHDEVDDGQYSNCKEIGACSGGAMVIWKHIFFEVGCFDSLFFMYYEDVDLSWRIKRAGYRILPAYYSTVYHIGSGSADVSSPLIGFHLVKNHITCWLKNSRCRIIMIYWPIVLLVMLGWVSFNIAKRRPRVAFAQIRGLLWPIRNLGGILGKRSSFRNSIKKHEDDLLFVRGAVKGSTNLQYAVKRYKSKIART